MKTTLTIIPTNLDGHLATDNPIANALRAAVGLPRADLKTCRKVQAFCEPSRHWARHGGKMIKGWNSPEVTAWLSRWYDTGIAEPITLEVDIVPATQVNSGWMIPGTETYGNG